TLRVNLHFESTATRKFLAVIPYDKLTWKPHDKSMALGRLAWHLSDFPSWLTDTVTKDNLTFKAEDMPAMRDAWQGKAPGRGPGAFGCVYEERSREPGRHTRGCLGAELDDGDGWPDLDRRAADRCLSQVDHQPSGTPPCPVRRLPE